MRRKYPTDERDFSLHPRLAADTILLGDLPLCRLLLMNESRYPWFILVPRRAEVREMHHLAESDRLQLLAESTWLCEKLEEAYAPDKLNVAALGNVVPQLHLHHIVRYEGDDAWPAPVWGKFTPTAYEAIDLDALRSRLAPLLADGSIDFRPAQ